jgi:hypothetical protein
MLQGFMLLAAAYIMILFSNSQSGACEGECDGDMECQGDLKCFHRGYWDVQPVPGCESPGIEGM